ncbi:TlpA family protein disulfide reductase [Pedobacter gandavensis]|uniref:Redoxin domain-containing protein n=1 Tax=Pedobacter gandavensis TaxID=2679963 RepID=A0ABR6ERT5_9SPHI|nr:TlpA disulfide reductase family protein [Pedobacter gandavensis]MBB2147970.1 redoxin domain-containing protein [Pedobacter gandavensis]
MKNLSSYLRHGLFILIPLLLISGKPASNKDDLKIFKQVSERLNTLTKVKYHYSREFSYPSDNYRNKSEGDLFVEFGKENDLVGFRYQFIQPDGFSIFNNSEIFNGDVKSKTMTMTNQLQKSSLEGKSALYNSLITLRNLLPQIISDQHIPKSVTDTLIDKKSYYLLRFDLQNKLPNYLGTAFTSTTVPLYFYHKLIVDKKTLLPLTLLQTKKNSEDLNRTDFTKIETQPLPPKESSWYYSSYLNDYKIEDKKPVTMIKVGEMAPSWALKSLSTDTTEQLSAYKRRLTLLEFWIKNCGYCIEAVPGLNDLHNSFKPEDFKILAINTEDNKKSIELFANKNKVKYTVLYGEESKINKDYGISAFPQVVLIDQSGKVIYAGNFDLKKLKPLIEKHI